MVTAREALERLREGNRRFVSQIGNTDAVLDRNRRAELAMTQQPFAIILGCSDSRVPAEPLWNRTEDEVHADWLTELYGQR